MILKKKKRQHTSLKGSVYGQTFSWWWRSYILIWFIIILCKFDNFWQDYTGVPSVRVITDWGKAEGLYISVNHKCGRLKWWWQRSGQDTWIPTKQIESVTWSWKKSLKVERQDDMRTSMLVKLTGTRSQKVDTKHCGSDRFVLKKKFMRNQHVPDTNLTTLQDTLKTKFDQLLREINRGLETSESISSEETEEEEQLKLLRGWENGCQWSVSRQYVAFARKDMLQDTRLRKRDVRKWTRLLLSYTVVYVMTRFSSNPSGR